MNDFKLDKNNYDKFLFKAPLAIECYCDLNKLDEETKNKINNMFLQKKEYNEKLNKNIEEKEKLITTILNIINELGIDNFTIYDDGDIEYN